MRAGSVYSAALEDANIAGWIHKTTGGFSVI